MIEIGYLSKKKLDLHYDICRFLYKDNKRKRNDE